MGARLEARGRARGRWGGSAGPEVGVAGARREVGGTVNLWARGVGAEGTREGVCPGARLASECGPFLNFLLYGRTKMHRLPADTWGAFVPSAFCLGLSPSSERA